MVIVPLLVLTGRVAAALTERAAELFALSVIEKVDALNADLPPWREEPR
jgi:ABC-type transporter Mla maintaining outer membrane lipid asymmetry permease subunit MlaE